MTTIQHQSEALKRAVKWVSEQRKYEADKPLRGVLDEAVTKFDLSPLEAEFLDRFIREEAGSSVGT